MSREFTNGPADWGSIESYQRLKKMIFDAALLNTQYYKVRVKLSNPENGVAPSPTRRYSSYWKGSFGSPSTKIGNLYWLTPVI